MAYYSQQNWYVYPSFCIMDLFFSSRGMNLYSFSFFIFKNIVDDIPFAVHYLPMIELFYNWKFVPLNPLQYVTHSSTFLLSGNPLVCSLWVCFCFVILVLFCFLDSTSKWKHTVFVFLCLTYFTRHNNFQIHWCCCKWQELILCNGWVISHVYLSVCLSIYLFVY